MGGHVLGALVEGQVVPVVFRFATLGHRVERHVLGVGDRRIEAGLDVAADPGRPVGVTVEVLPRLFRVPRGLGHGDVGRRTIGVTGEVGPFELAGERVEVGRRWPEVDHQQIGLVAQDRVAGGVARVCVLDGMRVVEVRDARLHGPLTVPFRGGLPRVPVDGPEIVQRVPSLGGGRRLPSRWHGRTFVRRR